MAECDPNEVIQACWACRPQKEIMAGIVGLLCDISTNGCGGCDCWNGERVTSNTYTVTADDSCKVILFDSGSKTTVTLPNDLPAGFSFIAVQLGAGQVAFDVESGGTLNPTVPGDDALSGQYAAAYLNVASNTGTDAAWGLCGDTAVAPPNIVALVYVITEADNGHDLNFLNTVTQVVVVPSGLSNGFTCSLTRLGTGMLHIFPRSAITTSTVNGYRVDTLGTATISIAGATVTIGGSITTDLIECGGIAPGSFAAGSNLNNPFTVIDGTTATFIRQDGFMRGVIFNVFAADNDPAGFSYRIFRPNGATYDFVGKSEDFGVPVIEVGANHTQRFTTPVACRAEDRSGFFTDSNFNSISCKAGGTTRFVSADQQSSNAFAGTVAFTINHQVLAVSPIVCCTGDSIMAGTAAGSNFTPYLDGGPSGTLTSQIPFQLRTSIGYGFEFQNLASAGQTFAWVRSTGVPACIAAKASWIWIHCGVNDVATGRLWSAVEADLDAIKALCVNGERLIIDEILPWTAGTDPQAATLRTFNANLATWCSANSATLLVCHDAMGQLRVSTGFLDDLKTAYNQDGVHLKQAGVDAMAAIAQAAFGLT